MENNYYDNEFLNELCSKVDLLEYAKQSYTFEKKGTGYYCSCPKHSDSSPSLCITPDVNKFHCFSCDRKGGIINWLMEYEDLSFHEAVNKIAKLTNTNLTDFLTSETINYLKKYNKIYNSKKNEVINRTILDIQKDYFDKYKDEVPQEWIDDDISAETMKKYEIRIDPSSNRIVYPVYDADYNLIGVKGRTRFKDYKNMKLTKYMNYYKVGIVDYFQGMKQAEPFVEEKKEIIILEGLKSVMKLDGWGYHNAVSAETSSLNDYQIELLVKMHVKNVVIAFDKDVQLKKIKKSIGLLRKFTNCFAVVDKYKLLDEKDSPCDKGLNVWKQLYERRVKV